MNSYSNSLSHKSTSLQPEYHPKIAALTPPIYHAFVLSTRPPLPFIPPPQKYRLPSYSGVGQLLEELRSAHNEEEKRKENEENEGDEEMIIEETNENVHQLD